MIDNNEDKSIRLEDLAQVTEVPVVETARLNELRRVYSPQEIMIALIPYELANAYGMVPISLTEDGHLERTITVVVVDPQNNKDAIDYLKHTLVGDYLPRQEKQDWITHNVRILTASEDHVKRAIGRLYEAEAGNERIDKEVLPVLTMLDELDKAAEELQITGDEVDRAIEELPENKEP